LTIVFIIIIIIIIGKAAIFELQLSFENLPEFSSSFHFFGFRNNFFLQSKIVSLASNPQPGGPGLRVYIPQ
jgi:hypothetical protein